jgi:hypothetical protein
MDWATGDGLRDCGVTGRRQQIEVHPTPYTTKNRGDAWRSDRPDGPDGGGLSLSPGPRTYVAVTAEDGLLVRQFET